MEKKQEFQPRNNNQGNFQGKGHRPKGEHNGYRENRNYNKEGGAPRENQHREATQRENYPQRDGAPRENQHRDSTPRENQHRESAPRENQHRENYQRPSYSNQNYGSRSSSRVKAVETIDDIKADILRIEKEIDLEIKEIRSLKLGL